MSFLDLPPELIHEIFLHLTEDDPNDWVRYQSRQHLVNAALVCRSFHGLSQVLLSEDLVIAPPLQNQTRWHITPLTSPSVQLCKRMIAGDQDALAQAQTIKRCILTRMPNRDTNACIEALKWATNLKKLSLTYLTSNDELLNVLMQLPHLEELRLRYCRISSKMPRKFKKLKLKRLELWPCGMYRDLIPYINYTTLQRWRIDRLRTLLDLKPFVSNARVPLRHLEVGEFDLLDGIFYEVVEPDMLAMFPRLEKLRYDAINPEVEEAPDHDFPFTLTLSHLPLLRHLELPASQYLPAFLDGHRPLSYIDIRDNKNEEGNHQYQADRSTQALAALHHIKHTLQHLVLNIEVYYNSTDEWDEFTMLRTLELRAEAVDVGDIERMTDHTQTFSHPNVDCLVFRLGPSHCVPVPASPSANPNPMEYYCPWLHKLQWAFPSLRKAVFIGKQTVRLVRDGQEFDWRAYS